MLIQLSLVQLLLLLANQSLFALELLGFRTPSLVLLPNRSSLPWQLVGLARITFPSLVCCTAGRKSVSLFSTAVWLFTQSCVCYSGIMPMVLRVC